MALWPLFGAVNQVLAALALTIITLYLKTKGGVKWLISAVPAIFVAVMSIWGVILNQTMFLSKHNALLTVINAIILIVAVWIVIEGVARFFTVGGETAAGQPQEATS
jgi:carbon starvation protein